jgi:hypothetical protein
MQLPVFQKRAPLSAADLNLLVDVLKRARVLPGVGIKLTETLNGTVVSIKPTPSFGEIENFPFKIKTFFKDNSYSCTVNPGTLNNLLPTNLFSGDELTFHSYSKGAVTNVILKGKSNGKQFTSCEISVGTAAPAAQPPTLFGLPSDIEILLGVVYNGTVYQVVKTRLELAGKQLFLKNRDEPAQPGELPYEAFFIWA